MNESDILIFPFKIFWSEQKQKVMKLPDTDGWQDPENNVPLTELPDPIEPYGINCGASGLVVIDFDNGFDKVQAAGMGLDVSTMIVRTQGGGFHLYYHSPRAMQVKTGTALIPGVDVRAKGGCVVGPGTAATVRGQRVSYEVRRGGWDTVRPLPAKLWAFLDDRGFIIRPPTFREAQRARINANRTVNPAEVASALKHIRIETAGDYNSWRDIGFALKSAGLLAEFLDWSRGLPGYVSDADCMKQWEKWDDGNRKSKPITIGTVFHLAKQNGWEKNPVA